MNIGVARIALCPFDTWMRNEFILGRMWGPIMTHNSLRIDRLPMLNGNAF